MSGQPLHPSIAALWNEPLPPDEFDRRVRAAIAELDGDEYENVASLVRWFLRRYPTARDRLRFARRRYAEAVRVAPK